MLLGCLAPYVHPATSGVLAILGMGATISFALTFLLGTMWVIYWNRTAIVCFVALLVCLSPLSLLVQVPVVKQNPPQSRMIMKLLTLNAHFFTSEGHRDVLNETLLYIDSLNPDVVCLQEMATSKQDIVKEINKKLSSYRYSYVHSVRDTNSNISYYSAIYSKFNIVNKGSITHNAIANSTIYIDIAYHGDTVRVVNNHLQSNYVSREERQFLTGEDDYQAVENNFFKMFTIIKKLSLNNSIRAQQAETVADEVLSNGLPIIVTGDLNSPPVSYVYRKIRGELQDAFINCGKWYGYTYKSFAKMFRIDYVFHSSEFTTISYSSPNVLSSDHKPVIVEMKYYK